mmetsp:Transcript_8304/g.37100  ORF Transcript_8304/g.37100 Transcript_8304/m.37100 type:complete len:94 (-) Transcript_8304:939-1220(-)
MLAAVVLAVPASVAYRLTSENIHVGAGSMIYFCFVGSLLLVLPRFTSTLLSGFRVRKRTILLVSFTTVPDRVWRGRNALLSRSYSQPENVDLF